MDGEVSVLICMLVAEGEPHVQSVVAACADCGRAVWCAHSSPKVDRILCADCAGADLMRARAHKQRIEIMSPTDEQRREVDRYFEEN